VSVGEIVSDRIERDHVVDGVADNIGAAHPGNGWMAAFMASSRKAVHQSYAAAIAAGGQDEGAPG
jgi:hypothetical protein